jgi:tRNA (cytidine/uridine-2'-O-)-methyltransferase
MINIVLVEPEIPQNTGNIARTCAATGSKLHLVKPLGFDVSDAHLKRAGLDYWQDVDIYYYDSLYEFLEMHKRDNMFFASTKAAKTYTEVIYPDDCYILFGKETKGLDEQLLRDNYEFAIRIPSIPVIVICISLRSRLHIIYGLVPCIYINIPKSVPYGQV